MASTVLGKVAITLGGEYNPNAVYQKLTAVIGVDGQCYVSKSDNVSNVSPGVTNGWENYWALFSKRGSGIARIEKTGTDKNLDTYTIYYDDTTHTDTFIVTNGNGIVSIVKTGTAGTVDTYTINYSDGTTGTFTVTNGEGIQSIVKTSTVGSLDTYTMTFGNNQTATFTVKNAVVGTYQATFPASGWSASVPYTQTVSVPDILSTDYPLVDVNMDGAATQASGDALVEAWAMVGRISTASGTITGYCYDEKPTVNIPIIIKVVN